MTDRLTEAYEQLLAEKRRPTVRALRDRTGVTTMRAAEFLRGRHGEAPVPPMPDLADPMTMVWRTAWRGAREAVADELDAARMGEVEALSDLARATETAETARGRAEELEGVAARASREAEALRREVALLTEAVQARDAQIERLRRRLREAVTAPVTGARPAPVDEPDDDARPSSPRPVPGAGAETVRIPAVDAPTRLMPVVGHHGATSSRAPLPGDAGDPNALNALDADDLPIDERDGLRGLWSRRVAGD